jgi:hypothetical protein
MLSGMYFIKFEIIVIYRKVEDGVTLYCVTMYTVKKMSQMQAKKEKNQAVVRPSPVPGSYSFNITDTNSHDGREIMQYTDIYDMFQNEKYSSDDEDIDKYKNIRKSGIHIVAAHPTFFPTMMLQDGVSLTCRKRQQ